LKLKGSVFAAEHVQNLFFRLTYPVSAEGSVVVASDGDAGIELDAVLVGELEQLKTTA